jgi:lysozyme
MKTGPKGVALIQQFEGLHKVLPDGRVQAYPDPATGGDPWTIGWGSTGPDVRKGTVWTRAQCDARLLEHLAEFEGYVNGAIKTATQDQFDALVSFTYNLGPRNFRNSTLLKKHNAGDYIGASKEFGKWNKAAGKVMKGLTRRREAESRLYRGDAL